MNSSKIPKTFCLLHDPFDTYVSETFGIPTMMAFVCITRDTTKVNERKYMVSMCEHFLYCVSILAIQWSHYPLNHKQMVFR